MHGCKLPYQGIHKSFSELVQHWPWMKIPNGNSTLLRVSNINCEGNVYNGGTASLGMGIDHSQFSSLNCHIQVRFHCFL